MSPRLRLRRLLVLGALLPLASPLRAQQVPATLAGLLPAPDTTALNQMYANLEPAELIGPSLLGLNANSVSRPGGIQDISLSLIRSFVTLPTGGNGVGIEFSPYQLLAQTKVDSLKGLPKQGSALLKTFVPQYRALEDYRRTFALRGLTLSGASAGDSVSSRLAAGISYTFGAGQLDPYQARDFMENITASITQRLNPTAQSVGRELQTYATLLDAELVRLGPLAGLSEPTLTVMRDELSTSGRVADLPQGSPLRVPQQNATSKPPVIDADSVRAALKAYFTRKNLTNTQSQLLLDSLSVRVIPAYHTLRGTVARLLQPAFADVKTLVKTATEAFERNNWNAPLLQVGAGQVWISPDHAWNSLTRQSVHGFLRGSLRPPRTWGSISQHAQLILNAQYSYQARDMDSIKHKLAGGLRLLLGNAQARLSADYLWQRQLYRAFEGATQSPQTLTRWTIGAEVRVVDNLWFEAAFGKGWPPAATGAVAASKASIVTLGGLKYGFRNRRRFAL
ncbi:hypothetical protein EJV47_20080 [Hymenobacter gummosus]|uniref:Uncharacterized protein n=1 Tax=Hymenobacter gummosus TaxID=1776032 RepID=A0A431TZ33_9BACT|nr:hypothetical protein [Hymenobacter gummosus]RTQ47195.1 hypothetical protein EJV47_20080 [Hymenobacter gummosus]